MQTLVVLWSRSDGYSSKPQDFVIIPFTSSGSNAFQTQRPPEMCLDQQKPPVTSRCEDPSSLLSSITCTPPLCSLLSCFLLLWLPVERPRVQTQPAVQTPAQDEADLQCSLRPSEGLSAVQPHRSLLLFQPTKVMSLAIWGICMLRWFLQMYIYICLHRHCKVCYGKCNTNKLKMTKKIRGSTQTLSPIIHSVYAVSIKKGVRLVV